VCITDGGAGVDMIWELENLEARNMLEDATEFPPSSARFARYALVFFHVI